MNNITHKIFLDFPTIEVNFLRDDDEHVKSSQKDDLTFFAVNPVVFLVILQ